MGRREDPRDASDRELLRELEGVYGEVGVRYEGWSCPASTDCCRFAVTGREPYVTSIEEAALRAAVARLGGPRALPVARRRALPLADEERRCPMLDEGGRCVVYAARPLGCRTFYCDRASAGARVKQGDVNALVRRVQDIAARHRPDGDRGRPLTRALADLKR